MKLTQLLPFALCPLALASCTVIQIDGDNDLPGLRVDGIVTGHAAFGMSDESGIFEARIFDGPSDGGVASMRISNLLGVEVGLLGAAFNIGPLHLGLGTLFYEPNAPYIDRSDTPDQDDAADDSED